MKMLLKISTCMTLFIVVILCVSASVGDRLVGGQEEIKSDDFESLKPSLTETLAQLKGQENGAQLELLRINSAQKQIVAGVKFYISADFLEGSRPKTCNVVLWEQLWNGFRETEFDCDDDKKYKVTKEGRPKRDVSRIVGGASDVEPETVEELRKNISESFAQLGAEPNGAQLQVNHILDAKKKVVAGVLYTLHAEITSPQGNKNCTIEVWEKPWIDFRQVDVRCDNGENYQVVKDNRPKRASLTRPLLLNDEMPKNIEESPEMLLFEKFKSKFGRNYLDEEEHAMRYRIFKQNLFQIRQLNKFELGTAKYGITDFADLTLAEYRRRTGLKMRPESNSNELKNPIAEIPDIILPKSFDWREKNTVTSVKDQGNCGSCWAFSVTGNIEGLHAVKSGSLESYSEQELVDCDKIDAGCNGGLPDDAYKAIESIGGLELETEYPYKARKSACQFNKTLSHVKVSGAIDLPQKDEDAIAKWLTVNGPVSIGINANAMQFYRGGVSHPWKVLCRASALDHGVLLVGYGIAEYPMFNKTLPYWIVKNSWGPKWGEQGYYRVYRGDNTCGVSSMASSAVLD